MLTDQKHVRHHRTVPYRLTITIVHYTLGPFRFVELTLFVTTITRQSMWCLVTMVRATATLVATFRVVNRVLCRLPTRVRLTSLLKRGRFWTSVTLTAVLIKGLF